MFKELKYGIIAEIGQNHNGSIIEAKKLVDMAANAGCWSAKTAKRDIASFPEKWMYRGYDNKNSYGLTYYNHRVALELSNDDFIELMNYTREKGMVFGSSFTDLASLNFLIEIKVDYLKIASSRVVDTKLLKAAAKAKLPIILSTGMSTIDEVLKAASILRKAPERALMQCTSSYPTKIKDLNLNILDIYRSMAQTIGLSCHSNWLTAAVIAMAKGCKLFEFHITQNKNDRGTDHSFSLDYQDLINLSILLNRTWESLGSYDKKVLDCELPVLLKLRDDLK